MTARIRLLPAGAGDAPEVARLHAESWRHAYRGLLPDTYLDGQAGSERLAAWSARLRDGAEGPLEVTLAHVDGRAAGFSCLRPLAEPERGVYLDNLHVLPGFQGFGLGKHLLAHCAGRAAGAWPGRPLFLYVLDGNAQARDFYRRLGGTESAPFPDRFPGPDVDVAVRSVSWSDVPALLRRLAPGAGPASR